MLGRKDYTHEEIAHAKSRVHTQLGAYRSLADAVGAAGDPKVTDALAELERVLFANLVLVLDRLFVHRIRAASGKDGNPLNEVELLAEALLGDGVFRGNQVIRYSAERSVTGIELGTQVRLSADGFETPARAVFAELEARFT